MESASPSDALKLLVAVHYRAAGKQYQMLSSKFELFGGGSLADSDHNYLILI